MKALGRFLKNVLLSVDQTGNVFLLGSADETISARSYREGALNNKTRWKAMRWFVDKLFFFEPDHTKKAYEAELARCHMPSEYQQEGAVCETPVNKDELK